MKNSTVSQITAMSKLPNMCNFIKIARIFISNILATVIYFSYFENVGKTDEIKWVKFRHWENLETLEYFGLLHFHRCLMTMWLQFVLLRYCLVAVRWQRWRGDCAARGRCGPIAVLSETKLTIKLLSTKQNKLVILHLSAASTTSAHSHVAQFPDQFIYFICLWFSRHEI